MKRIVRFSKGFLPAAIISTLLVLGGAAGYIINRGFNLGIDFKAGLIQEVQFAPGAFSLTYTGGGNAVVSLDLDRNTLYIAVSGAGMEKTHAFPLGEYGALGSLKNALEGVEGISVRLSAPEDAPSSLLVQSARGNPQLGTAPYVMHYLPPDRDPVSLEALRAALGSLGDASVQVLGRHEEQRYMIRMDDTTAEGEAGSQVIAALENAFGPNSVAVARSDYVGSRFSKNLTDQTALLMGLTLLLILIYASIRFKPQYAVGAVLAIAHDALMMTAFITWTRMEFNTTTIAALLTILGYSINDTIVIFDRIRETRRIYPVDPFVDILDRAISETLGRTVITTLTTMLAVLSLFIFTAGSMKDFALALLVGMVCGVYSTIFIASGFVYYWDVMAKKQARKKGLAGAYT